MKLPAFRVMGYGAGDAGCNVAFQMTGLFLLLYYTDVVGISPVDAGTLFLFVKIWDAFADIFAGRLVDRTMTRWGKFRPFLLWYAAPLLIVNVLCFAVPDFSSYGLKLAWAYGSYAALGLLYSLVNIPYGSLAGAMSQDPVDRSRLAGARMVGSGATILLLALILAPRLKDAANLHTTFVITAVVFAVIGMALFMTTFFTAREKVFREVDHVSVRQTWQTIRHNGPLLRLCLSSVFYLTGQNVISALAIYLSRDVLGRSSLNSVVTIITVGAVLYVGPFGPWVTRRMGKKQGFMVACGVAIGGGLLFGLSGGLTTSLVGLGLIGIGMALLNTMTWALESDTVEYGEWKTGIRTEGATYALFSFTRKVGQSFGAALAGYALAWAGYQESTAGSVTQSAATLDGIRQAVFILPAVCFLLALVVMASYPLTEKRFQQLMTDIRAGREARAPGDGVTTPQPAR